MCVYACMFLCFKGIVEVRPMIESTSTLFYSWAESKLMENGCLDVIYSLHAVCTV